MPSLLEAINKKYGLDEEEEEDDSQNDCEVQFVIYGPKVTQRLKRVLVLDKCDVDSAGEESDLKGTLAELQELDLTYNRLTELNDVWKILRCAPRLAFINLSYNDLSSTEVESAAVQLPQLNSLSVLILIGTKLSWKFLHTVLASSKNLKELHLSKNEYQQIDNVGINGENAHFPQVAKLMFNSNQIICWDEIQKLGQIFSNLSHLGLSDSPISIIPENAFEHFQNIKSISVSNTYLKEMSDLANLHRFPLLTDLRAQGTLIMPDLTAHERRQMFIALLPNVQRLNGGAIISKDEREASERAFIRYFLDKEELKPKRYDELVNIHGQLQQLVDIQFKPKTKAKIKFMFDELEVEREITLYQTVRELKTSLEPIFGIKPSRINLQYFNTDVVSGEIYGTEEMRFPDKQLFSYNIQDGNEIHLHLKS